MNKPDEKERGFYPPPYMAEDTNRIDINLIAMLLWQALLTGISVAVSHMGWYLPNAGAGEMGLQYGLIAFGFLCTSMVLFHVGGIRDSLAMRAEFSRENQIDKWYRQQQRLQQRRATKEQYWRNNGQQNPYGKQQFGLPNDSKDED
tara:strand:+ start:148 stop:585 length:438 start_codon:yes stop_codon:yes gene_type:complete